MIIWEDSVVLERGGLKDRARDRMSIGVRELAKEAGQE